MNQVFKLQPEVDDRLAELGLTREILQEVVTVGLVGWLSCTENHPPSFAGTYSWGEMVRSLRENLLPRGWERVNDRNLPLTANVDNQVALTASSGDEGTGIESMSPRTRNPKGSATKELATANAVQLGLFSDMPTPPQDLLAEVKKWDTWLLLTYRDRGARVVRYELSRPVNIGDDGRVDGWDERIILGEIPFDGDQFSLSTDNSNSGRNSDGSVELDSQSEVIDVPVKRRA